MILMMLESLCGDQHKSNLSTKALLGPPLYVKFHSFTSVASILFKELLL